MYYEYASDVFKRKGTMLTEAEVKTRTGFRSLYGFDEKDAKSILHSGHSKGFSRFAVFASQLVIDFDDGYSDELKRAMKLCGKNKFTYCLWSSGSKGYHLEVETVPKYDVSVPYSQQKILESMHISADYSMYQHGRLYRLPNTVHAKTGNRKSLVEAHSGEYLLDYELFEQPNMFSGLQRDFDEDHFEIAMFRIRSLYKNCPAVTKSRTQTLFGVALQLTQAGMPAESTTQMLSFLNKSWDRPKEESTIIEVVRQAQNHV